MATSVEQAITEINERIATFAPQHEGLRDYDSLDIQPHSHEVIQEMIVKYDRRTGLLLAAKQALEALMADGHPDIPVQEIDDSVLKDLQENASTIEAALSRFSSNAASALTLKAGATGPK